MSRLFIICFIRLTALVMCNSHIHHCQSVWWGRIIDGLTFVSTCFINVFRLILQPFEILSVFNRLGLAALKGKLKFALINNFIGYVVLFIIFGLSYTSFKALLLISPMLRLIQTSLYTRLIAKFYIVLPTFYCEMFKNNFRSLSLIELKALSLAI